ncbi:MAG: zf-HC2 domain-containing protein [Gemmatimonadota bacterium]
MPISRGPCRDFLDEFSSFVDGSLDPGRRSLLIAHLDCCEACLRHLKAYRKGIAVYREANAPVPAWGLYERVLERLGGDIRPALADADRDRTVAPRRFRGGVGAVLVMAVLAMLVFVSPAGLDFRAGPSRTVEPASEAAVPPASWASVIPAALPQLAPVERERVTSPPRRPTRTVASEAGLQIERLPVVPRREVRVISVNDISGVVPTGGFGGWPPRRPPVTIYRTASIMPAAWVAEAALRIP